jgi:N6-adenosine-specific RNA methylase IME4
MTHEPPLFAPLPRVDGGYGVVHADPPLRFHSNSRENPGRNAMRHYKCWDYPDFEKLPVADVVANDALLALSVPSPFLAIGAHLPLIRAGGFKPSSIGFTWLKVNRNGSPLMGPGLVTRKCCEFVVLGRRGKPPRLSNGVLEIIIAEPREHSRKPDEIYARLEALTPGPCLDLFARQRRDGWTLRRSDQSIRFRGTATAPAARACSRGARLSCRSPRPTQDPDQMTDQTYTRIILLLTRVYSGANPFWLSRLGGRDERETAETLAMLERRGLAFSGDGARWILTEAGEAACQPPRSERPGSIIKQRRGRGATRLPGGF